ncbi:hemolysin-type calcium-binding region [Pseudomonas monteilii SB3101]|jgi:hypothetical protein|uniref:Hemolysin-type calcium-binding region n=1 Tax=Pseudomonas monteilii SB3101 TaxID=1435058 RepID=V9UXM4_9PSED|nr:MULTISPECIES: DUF4214 domain-containing protein [Pseudomonas]AHC81384.1 hemolysin-type calcium-binding region [Pseudomonas monteilii SB3078]AHC86813.1 hemolysin-type calcium-binding region [Pseudomonas monteilii SB3101]MCK2124205.1 DUF4214 domain-containing protein [Pseudomonas sp. PNPG3]
MQYDSPVSSTEFQSFLAVTTLSDSTVDAISSLLGLDAEGTTVNVANFDGVNLELPASGAVDVVTGEIAGVVTDLVTVDLSEAEAAGARAYILESDASLNVTLQGQSGNVAPVAFAALAADIAVSADANAEIELLLTTGNGNDVITVNGDQNTYIDGGDGNDTIVTGNGNNTVIAGAGNNNVKTGSGSDTVVLSGSDHTDIVDTGAGYDVVQLDGSRADYQFATNANFNVTLTGNQTASISNAEFLTFVNGDEVETVALAHSADEAAALRLYQGVLNRDADLEGAKAFVGQVNAGTSLTDIANEFLNSNEFAGAHNAADVNELYLALLGRVADDSGASTWTDLLANGGSLADVAAAIAVSSEAQTLDQSNGDFIRDLYTNVLGRAAEQQDLDFWVNSLFNGASRADVAKDIVTSNEAGVKANNDFVESLYTSALGRASEAGEKEYWTAQIEAGASHADVALGIVGSNEAVAHIDNVVVLHGQV